MMSAEGCEFEQFRVFDVDTGKIFSHFLWGNQGVGYGCEESKVNGLCDCVRTRTRAQEEQCKIM